ncbi:MAG: leucine-rich repeat domain-containing protein [Muribaculaceae bacterium]|nr:leucine-rich repeat domain-containing protein [Muribaculaceae bacterium]
MKRQTNYHALMRLLVCCLIGISSLWSNAVTIGDLKYDLNDATKEATVTGPVSKSVTSVVIPETVNINEVEYSVTTIGHSAFGYCSGLTEVTIPNSVTTIGYSAFDACSGLTEVTIPNSVTTIGEAAFHSCKGITSLTIPNSVTTIYGYAFAFCRSLNSLTLPNSVTYIGKRAFYGCTGIKELIIEEGEKELSIEDIFSVTEESVFYDCPLESVYLGRNLNYPEYKRQGYSPFSSKTSLISLTIGNSVTTIDELAFMDCSGLTELTIGDSVTSIGDKAFYGCSGLTELTIPNSVTSIGKSAFEDCSGLTSLTLGDSVTSIGKSAFEDCSGLTSLTIPNSVTSIGSSAFSGCSGLTSLTIPNSVTTISSSAFSGCGGLTSLTIPNSVTTISSSAFYGCSGLTSLNIPNSVTSIGSSAFYGCSSLASLTIGDSVTSIGDHAFSGCSGLTDLTLPNSVSSIGSWAFNRCAGLRNIIIEDGEKELSLGYNSYSSSSWTEGQGLFYDCPLETLYLGRNLSYEKDNRHGYSPFYSKTTLTSLTIGNSVTSIGSSAFSGCSGLTSVTIPNSVTSLGSSAFSGCSALESAILSNNLTEIQTLAFQNTGLKEIEIPNSVTSLGSSAFSGCSALESAILSNNLTEIQTSAFQNTGLKEIEIPYKVGSIAKDAFRGCQQLEKVILPASLTKAGSYAFGECPAITQVYSLNTTPPVIESSTFDTEVEEKASLHVKKGSMVHYWLDPVWKEFKNMNEDLLCLEAIPTATYGDGEIDLAQYAPEGMKLRYETSNSDVVEINGNMMRIVGAGEATVGAILDEEQGTPMELMGQMRQFVVDKADLEITVAEIVIEAGQPLPDFSYLAKGLQYDDTLDDIEELPEPVCDVDEYSPMGEYPVYFTEGNDRNYNIATKESKVIVGAPSGVENGSEAMMDNDSEIEVYTLNGMFVYRGPRKEAQLERGVYIVRQGKVTAKIIVR